MRFVFSLLFSIFLLEGALAFSPPKSARPTSSTMMLTPAWGVPSARTKSVGPLQAADDDDFEGIDLERLLGPKQLKRMARKRRGSTRATIKSSTSLKAVKKEENAPSADPIKIIIAGAPASGKGTQCEVIKEKYGVVHLSTGDMLRAAVAEGTDVGKKAKEYMDSGKLVPDEVIIGVVKDRLEQSDCQKQGWLLDGFPRTPAQAQALAESGISADCFIFLNVPDEVLVDRVVGRRTDPETGKIYHMTFSPPEDEEVKARLVQRSDDTEEKVKVRLEQFHTNVDAVKDSYTDISVTIDGNQAPDVVSSAVFEAIDSQAGRKVAA